MADVDEWARQYRDEHGRDPEYDDYQDWQYSQQNRGSGEGGGWTDDDWRRYYAQRYNSSSEGDSSGSSGGGGDSSESAQATSNVNSWQDWMAVYGSQTPRTWDQTNEYTRNLQSGSGAKGLWSTYAGAAMGDTTDTQRQRLANRFDDEYNKYLETKNRRKMQGLDKEDAFYGWHNYLTDKGKEGMQKDWAYMSPEDRGERPWSYGTRQRVQWQ